MRRIRNWLKNKAAYDVILAPSKAPTLFFSGSLTFGAGNVSASSVYYGPTPTYTSDIFGDKITIAFPENILKNVSDNINKQILVLFNPNTFIDGNSVMSSGFVAFDGSNLNSFLLKLREFDSTAAKTNSFTVHPNVDYHIFILPD